VRQFLSVITVVYSSLSLLLSAWLYISTFGTIAPWQEAVAASSFVGFVVLMLLFRMDYRYGWFEWHGFIRADMGTIIAWRRLLWVAIGVFALHFALFVVSPGALDPRQPPAQARFYRTIATLQAAFAVQFLALSLFGSKQFVTDTFRYLHRLFLSHLRRR
jgi:hypothetical protein